MGRQYLTKKGTPIKNNSYRYGLFGELFVSKYVKCPKCSMKLWKLKANTPGVDIRCRNDHYYQIKSRNVKSVSDNDKDELRILGGSFTHQKGVIMGKEKADFLILYYDATKKKVVNLYWLQNKDILRGDVTKRTIKQKKISRKGGVKTVVGERLTHNSYIRCNKRNLIEIPLEKNCLVEGGTGKRDEPLVPDIYYESATVLKVKNKNPHFLRQTHFRIDIEGKSCDCPDFRRNVECEHLKDAFNYIENDGLKYYKSDRLDKEGNQMIYTLNLTERTCTCPHYAYNKIALCKHLRGALGIF